MLCARHGAPIAGWAVQNELRRNGLSDGANIHPSLRHHADYASSEFANYGRKLYRAMLSRGVKLADDQEFMVHELSFPIQKLVRIIATCNAASQKGDEATLLAADVFCAQTRFELNSKALTEKQVRAARENLIRKQRKLADMVIEGKFAQISGVPAASIMKPYENI